MTSPGETLSHRQGFVAQYRTAWFGAVHGRACGLSHRPDNETVAAASTYRNLIPKKSSDGDCDIVPPSDWRARKRSWLASVIKRTKRDWIANLQSVTDRGSLRTIFGIRSFRSRSRRSGAPSTAVCAGGQMYESRASPLCRSVAPRAAGRRVLEYRRCPSTTPRTGAARPRLLCSSTRIGEGMNR